MSYMKVSSAVAAAVTALALTAGAYGDTGKSPNGAPGPAGNPNQPAAAPQANGPQGPAGNNGNPAAKSHGKSHAKSHGKSGASHGKSNASHGKSQAQHGKSNASHGKGQSHANPNVGTPRKGGREDRPAGKITICHATKSVTNPYVEITISVNGLHGHGPAEDPHHHAGSWKDIIPAPAEGCPGTVQEQQQPGKNNEEQPPTTTTTTLPNEIAKFVATTPEVAVTAPATTPAAATPQQAVLGERVSGTTPAAATAPAASKVLGVQAAGTTAPKAAVAARNASDRSGSLPFTGFELVIVLLAAAVALLGGFALRRATTQGR
jgi:hypothetical protein